MPRRYLAKGSGMNDCNYWVGLGSVLAVAISWSVNESILWAMLHATFGWAYVIYYAFTR